MSAEEQGRAETGKSAVAFDQVSKGFGEHLVLDGLSFQVAPGEALCILGRSGIGKSVALKLMIGLLKADRGKVLVEENDMAALKPPELAGIRRKMGYMFQNGALADSFNLHDNLALPLRRLAKDKDADKIEEAIKKNLEQVGLEKDGAKMPVVLSGGMQKRAGLARALALEPEILLADEPTSGLDVITAHEITDLLCRIKSEKHTTMVVTTHDIANARRLADKFAILDEGRLAGFGTPEELDKSDNEVVKQFLSEG